MKLYILYTYTYTTNFHYICSAATSTREIVTHKAKDKDTVGVGYFSVS